MANFPVTVHVTFDTAAAGSFPALCNHNLRGASMKVFFAVDESRRCRSCSKQLRRKGYDLKALEARYRINIDTGRLLTEENEMHNTILNAAKQGGYLDHIAPEVGYKCSADLDGKYAAEFLTAHGFNVVKHYDTGYNGLAICDNGLRLSTNGHICIF